MSERNSPSPIKGFEVLNEVGKGEHSHLLKTGAVWKSSKSDCFIGDTVHGKVILKPILPKEELDALREQQSQKASQQMDNNIRY